MVTSQQERSNRLLEVVASQRQDLETMFERLEPGSTDSRERRERVGEIDQLAQADGAVSPRYCRYGRPTSGAAGR